MELAILTCNVRGLACAQKRGGVFNFLGGKKFFVCFLQEVHLRSQEEGKRFSLEWTRGFSFWSVGGVHSSGVGILFGGRDVSIVNVFSFVQGRVLVVDGDWRGEKFRFINVYAPAAIARRKDFFLGLEQVCATSRWVVMGGDFNISWEAADCTAAHLKGVVRRFLLKDAFRAVWPKDPGLTWGNSRGAKSRLDYIFVPGGQRVVAAEVIPLYFSDHSGVVVTVGWNAPAFGRGCWRMNTQVLEEEAFRVRFIEAYKGWARLRPFFGSAVQWWEMTKARIKSFVIGYCQGKWRREQRRFSKLQRELEGLYTSWNGGGGFDVGRWERVKAELKIIYEEKARALAFKSQGEKHEKGETCSAFFFQRVRAARARRAMVGLRGMDGRVVRGTQEMVEVASCYYSDLFQEREVDRSAAERFLSLVEERVPEGVRAALELPFSTEELRGVLAGMKGGKVPGRDGLPREFYLKFWELVGPDFLEVVGEMFERGELAPSMREGVVAMLFKKGDELELKNWRPITLLGVDYKLIARALAGRLRLAMPYLVGEDQTCGVEGRSASWNLQLTRDVLCWVEERSLPLVFVSLDMEKAFDRVSHDFMFEALARSGFGVGFLRWLRLLYRGVGSRVEVNGHLGEMVWQKGGVRQGCPLSPLLFVLYMEPMAEAVRRDEAIRGIPMPGAGGKRLKISLYADDVCFFVDGDQSVRRAMEVVGDFARGAGASINVAKSTIKYFGVWKGRRDGQCGLQVSEGPVRVLGVEFGGDVRGDARHNWEKRIAGVKAKLGLWSARRLTLSGRVLALKADVLSVLVYLSYVFPLPVRLRRDLVRAVFKFLWGGYEYVRREVMYMAVEEGGRDVPHFPLKLDVLFYCNLCVSLVSPQSHKFQYFVRFWFSYWGRFLVGWDNRVPRGEVAPAHYVQVGRWARRYEECRDRGLALKHRALYRALKDRLRPVGGTGAPVEKEVWAAIQPKGLENRLRDLNWLVAYGRLPVRDVLYRHKLTKNRFCPREGCGREEETVNHVFWECRLAQEVWGWMGRRYERVRGVTREEVLFGEGLGKGKGKGKEKKRGRFQLLLLLSLVKQKLWGARGEGGWTGRGVVGMVGAEVERRFRWEVLRWGFHAAWERWKGLL